MRNKASVNHRILYGTISMDRQFFSKESLKAGSYLRLLLGLDHPQSRKVKDISTSGNTVTITYQKDDIVFVPDDIRRFFSKVKKAYKGKIIGTIVVQMAYAHVDLLDVTIQFEP